MDTSVMQSHTRPTKQSVPFFKRFLTWTAVILTSLAIAIVSSKTAHASLVSFVNNLLGGEQASANVALPSPVSNSQNIALLTAAANLDPNPDKPTDIVPVSGGDILVPDLADNNATGTDTLNTQISTYIVQKDDTLSSIANIFDISVDTIKQANQLTGSTLHSGQKLIILPVSGMLYTVQAGDSILKIATKLKADQSDILTYNGLTTISTITKGQVLIIPHGKPSATDIQSFLSTQKTRVPSSEPLLDAVWDWPTYTGYFICPLPGARLSQGLHGHNAVDLAIALGTPIRAAAAGTVSGAKSNGLWNGGYGNFVMISHPNGAVTLYAHMSKPVVSVGDHVYQGQTIGYVGMTGMTTGPHTHFEIRGAQNPFVDPALCQ
jgi:murein DD-endopeptidase MepM/ murein hydrolase activator NlpD